MNAVTAVARDTEDAEVRWDLEKLGGTLALLVPERGISLKNGLQRPALISCASSFEFEIG